MSGQLHSAITVKMLLTFMFIHYRLSVGHGLFVPASGRRERFLRPAQSGVFSPSCTRRAWNLLECGVHHHV